MATKLPSVVIIGQSNAGKSALFNRLLRSHESIVAREAGTTRDSVVRKSRIQGRPFWLIDTAGLKDAEDEFEASIQDQIVEATELADVIIVAVDSTVPTNHYDKFVAKRALRSKKPVLLVTTKCDLKSPLAETDFRSLGIKTIIPTSAEHNIGIRELKDELHVLLPERGEVPAEDDETLRIALIGRPNAGKSYLFNTLAGKQQAIVADVAGTTRDINQTSIRYHGQTIELLDTAGIRRPGKQEQGIEKFSVLRSLRAIEQADVCLLVMDANEPNTSLDQRLAGMIDEAGKGMAIVISKWDMIVKDDKTRDQLANRVSHNFKFTPWAPLVFTSSVTGQNVTKLFEIARDIMERRQQKLKTRELNNLLQRALMQHPPAGLKNTHPKLRYMVQTDTNPPWFVFYGSNLKFIHWSYKRYLERQIRENYDYAGTPIKFSFIDEKQIKSNAESGKDES